MSQKPIVLIVGTRPEGIKMVPVYFALKKAGLPVFLCSTAQHDELLADVFRLFDVQPDAVLHIMRLKQDLFYVTQSVLQKTKELFKEIQPSLVLVHGDTSTTMAASLSAFYLGIPVGHVEAGLRTDDLRIPFPEEMNRRVVGVLSDYHFAPTQLAVDNLKASGVADDAIFCTGNTVVDALRIMQDKIDLDEISIRSDIARCVRECTSNAQKMMLLTAHRRESFDGGLVRILSTMKQFLLEHPDWFCVYPFHPNPHVIQAIEQVRLSELANLYLCEPVTYENLVYLLRACNLVVTDSGGIQEEAISLGKQVLVLREKTERMEGVLAGFAHVVGTHEDTINAALHAHLQKDTHIMSKTSVYGDGYAAEKIVAIIQKHGHHKAGNRNTVTEPIKMKNALRKKDIIMKKVCVVGLGYIGLPTAIVAAEHNLSVVGFDIDEPRVASINQGDPVIKEPELFEKLQLALASGNFRATTSIEPANYFVVAVPTPFKEGNKADLSYVESAAKSIAAVLKKDNVIILESTVPVGATQKFARQLSDATKLKAGKDFFVAHCPERVLPGNIFRELIENDRVVGGINKQSVLKAKEFYDYFVRGNIYLTNDTTAEMVKLIENSARDAEVAFAHQVASMAYKVGLDPYTVIELANKHPRVNILRPTCGVGGHCLAVDPWFLVETFPEQTQLLKSAREVNDSKPYEVVGFIKQAVHDWQATYNRTCTVLLLGLTYKPNVDDLRESPAMRVAKLLQEDTTHKTLVCEPHVSYNTLKHYCGDAQVNLSEGIEQADIVVYLVAHRRFKAIDQKLLYNKRVMDFCGIVHEQQVRTQEQYMFWPEQAADENRPLNTTIPCDDMKESAT